MKTPPDLRQEASISVVSVNWESGKQAQRHNATLPRLPQLRSARAAQYVGRVSASRSKRDYSQQVWCRELTLCTERSGGSERRLSSNRPASRVDFIPKGISEWWLPNGKAVACEATLCGFDSRPSPRSIFRYGPQGSKAIEPQVLGGYPPYSRLALERVLTAKAVGGEAESGVFSNE